MAALLLLALLGPGCAGVKAARERKAALAAALDRTPCGGKELDEVWTEALRLLDLKGYPLAGKDAEAVGKSSGMLSKLFTAARETRADGQGGRVAETGFWHGWRYRVAGAYGDPGCHLKLLAIREDKGQPGRDDGDAVRDPDLELELLGRVAPEEAERIESGALPASPGSASPGNDASPGNKDSAGAEAPRP